MNARGRLLQLQQENDRAGAEMLIESARFDRIRGEKPRAVSAFNLFQTPSAVAEKMVALLPEFESPAILEPSAGLGNLYRAAFNRYGESAFYMLVESSPECCRELYSMNLKAELMQRDFLAVPDRAIYDIVIMNPPFKQGTDVKHILHARKFLRPTGVLVALCYNGVKQNKVLKPLANSWEVLPEWSFKSEGTGASVALLTLEAAK